MRLYLNKEWEFSVNSDFSDSQKVEIPHTNHIVPISYCNEKDFQIVSYYRRNLSVKQEWANKRLILTFDGVAHYAKVFVNGVYATEHYGGYTAFSVDIAPLCVLGDNEILVLVDSRDTLNIAPFGNVVDYLTYGGIYREVYLEVKNDCYIQDIFARGFSSAQPYNFQADITLNQPAENLSVRYFVLPFVKKEEFFDQSKYQYLSAELPQGAQDYLYGQEEIAQSLNLFGVVEKAELWSPDSPNLYLFVVQLLKNGEIIDSKTVRFGFRECLFTPHGFYLNGEKLVLRGLNRHQSYPYVGYAMPARPQTEDAKLLKNELCVNVVRTSHYPQSHHFINACDELGLLVITEIPGWQHIGDKEWVAQSLTNTAEMVVQYRNHPSIILWGVRINESADNDEFYSQTNSIAHNLDDTRQTGGTRYLKHSHLLEDVYTYNDFTHTGNNRGIAFKKEYCKSNSPMVITEFCGHMFPTKNYDDEPHRTKQAIMHYKVMKEYYSAKHLCGGIGWCMFDYNTNRDFGSGDRTCHHGVMDMFRNPKLSGYFYASQGEKPILEISSTFDKGEWPASNIESVYAFTNADSVKMYLNGTFIKEYFPEKSSIPHPPILIDDFLGDIIMTNEGFSRKSQEACKKCIAYALKNGYSHFPLNILLKMLGVCIREKKSVDELIKLGMKYATGWGDKARVYTFEGMKDGKVFKTVVKKSVEEKSFKCSADTTDLKVGDTYDISSVRIVAVDDSGNILSYCQEPIEFVASGSVELIGDSLTVFRGGSCGVCVKTVAKGKGKLTITSMGQIREINFTVG